ncbi:TadE family type IV pilus minor pilin [Mycolicibacterium neoaurum]|uniref:TadE family type IV pilus minor pilin n=1 Tax=Mycolicibacterium neoaurum TaxID=1795 RepID=UPI0026717B77|nr:TadE family type IV pilus minor pilin [Mycolicibacterium neoaurum]MDO3399803.1 TadE family type IV pilus minor pilin [Mycolicibacterium neoaurum]
MEAAFAIAALVAVLVVCLAGINATVLHIRCVDAAREAARLLARGDDGVAAARRVGPTGSTISAQRDGAFVVVRVSTATALLPGIVISADAVAMAEQFR